MPADVLGPEVTDLRFRYFDGSSNSWLEAWDGSTQGLPLAVEITMTIQPQLDASSLRTREKPPTTHRLVVSIPAASVLPPPTGAVQGGL